MRKGVKRVVFDDAYRSATMLDEIDTKIIAHLISCKENKEIANELKVPLSTIQRRVRKLFEKNTKVEWNQTTSNLATEREVFIFQ